MAGKWDRNKYMGTQVAGKTLGIVGLGRIGLAVAKRARALEMNVLGYDPFLSRDRAQELGIEPVETVDAMLPRVDYLTVHTPLTDETRGLIGAAQIEKLKPGVRLINAARGGIYDEAALAEGAQSRASSAAWRSMCMPPSLAPTARCSACRALSARRILGASTEEAQTQVAIEAVELLVAYLTTGAIRHAVNVASLDPKTLASLRGYLDVAYRLGMLLAGIGAGRPASRAACCIAARSPRRKPRFSPPCSPPACCKARSIRK